MVVTSSYRRILVPLTGHDGEQTALETAFVLAQRFNSHVDALSILPDNRDAIAFVGEGMTSAMIDQIMSAAAKDAAEQGNRLARTFEELRAKHSLPIQLSPNAGTASARFGRRFGREDDIVAEQGRLADLIVTPQPNQQDMTRVSLVLEAALRETGRSVLIIPPNRSSNIPIGNSVAIAWNGSVEVCRAIHFAKSILTGASQVFILSVAEDISSGAPTEDAAAYLAWHGIPATKISLQCTERAQGATLLAAARDHGADLMVQGAYTRSHMRRLIYGGVTSAVLAETTIPVFMAH